MIFGMYKITPACSYDLVRLKIEPMKRHNHINKLARGYDITKCSTLTNTYFLPVIARPFTINGDKLLRMYTILANDQI